MPNKTLNALKTTNTTENELIGVKICQAVQHLESVFTQKGHLAHNDPMVQKNLELIAEFYDVDVINALILVPYIQHRIIDNSGFNTSKLLAWLEADLSGAISITMRLNKLCIQGILIRSSYRYSVHDGLMLSKKGYMAILNNSPFRLDKEFIKINDQTFMESVFNTIDLFENEDYQFGELSNELAHLMILYADLELVKRIERLKLNDVEIAILFSILNSRVNYGIERIDMDLVMKELNIPVKSRWDLNKSINEGKSRLITENIIEFKNTMYKTTNDMVFNKDFLLTFKDFNVNHEKKKDIKRGTIIDPKCITEQELFYNASEEEEIKRLTNLLQEEQYLNVQQELKKQSLSSAVTVLFFGKPGTGKTSSVLDIARRTGRMVYKVEVETIKDAFVGESEKNLVEVFEEYNYLIKMNEKHPILLLNEADGLLKNRITNNTNSVNEMLNTMTTLLLEKLENFNGILFATVNEPVFDSAFDRRFLIKTELKLPETATRINIIRNQFPELDYSVLTQIAEQYPLTGGQISNIKRKLAMRKILDPTTDINACIIPLCEQEFVLQQTNVMKTISGFSLN